MTPQERHQLKLWIDHNEGWVVTYVVGGLVGLFVGAIVADVAASWLVFFGFVAFTLTWPLLLLALNAAVLCVRRRTNETLRFERRVASLDARERRIEALERSTGL